MNSVTVPPSPNWYESNILACAPDNTLIYGARNDIVILEKTSESNQVADVKIISHAHSQKILTVNVNKNWGEPKKLAVSASDDKIVSVWDIETCKKYASHKKHLEDNKLVAASFAGDDRVVSVSEDGNIVIWNIALKETTELKEVFGMKVMITCMSTCPHATWLTAFGLKSGLVIVADLRKTGKILHKMRGHDKSIISLSWCPAPINIFPKNPNNYVGQKKMEKETKTDISIASTDDVKEEIADNETNRESGIHLEMETHPLLKVYDSGDEDFLKECENLKNKILGTPDKTIYSDDTGDSSEEQLKQLIDKSILEKTGNNESQNNITDDEKLDVSKDIINLNKENNQINENPQIEEQESCDKTIENKDHELANKDIYENTEGEGSSTVLSLAGNINEQIKEGSIGILPQNPIEDECVGQEKIEAVSDKKNDIESSSTSSIDHVTVKSDTVNNTPNKKEDKITRAKVKSPPIEEEPRKEFLLASSARESNIYIWRAGTDGRMQTFISITGKFYNRKNRSNADKIWITLNWVTPCVLLSSSRDFELLAWNLPKPQNIANSYSVIHNDHISQLFSIAAPTYILNEYNWKDERKVNNAWTTSQDRLLLNTSINTDRTKFACYPTIGGHVECMQLSPLDPNRLAIGSADFFVRVWDLSCPHTNVITMNNFYHKIQSKVTALAWHPTNETILAYGTSEGRVGYVDPNSKSKPSTLLSQYFKSQIYKLEWGPINGNMEKFGLYAVSEGCVVYFNINSKSNQEPTIVATPENTFIYSFGWKPDYSQLFVIARAGFIIVYSPQMKVICKHYFSFRIHDIFWHPCAADSQSPYHNWLAVVASTNNVFVYKFDFECGNNDENILNMYQSESEMINSASWSPYVPTQMVVCCDMGIAQIWDVVSGQFLATFINTNCEPVTDAIWSPIDADFIISSGKDNTIKIWKISDYPPVDEKEIAVKRKLILKSLQAIKTSAVTNKEDNEEESLNEKKNRNFLLPKFYCPRIKYVVADFRKLIQWRENPESVTIMPNNSTTEILNIFGSDESMIDIVLANENRHKETGKYVLSTTLSLFRGDISTAVKEAIEEKRVTPYIISLAPMVSQKVWQLACETYAKQLSEEPGADAVEIATYYLACHKVQPAIDVLCDVNMHREALALVKCRMLGQEVANEVIEKWAQQAKFEGNFEVAAQCFIYLGKYEEAASLLFRRSNIDILQFVVELSEKTENVELHNAALSKYNLYKTEIEKLNCNDKQLPTIQDAVINQIRCNGNTNVEESPNSSGISMESTEMDSPSSLTHPSSSDYQNGFTQSAAEAVQIVKTEE